jgi:ATP-dependent RNA helicase DHX57
MVKKGQAKGSKSGSGTVAKKGNSATNGPDDSFIVFSNSDKEPKSKRTTNSNDVPSTDAGPSGTSGPALAGEATKRPDVKKLIGGASWTGKLPVNLLSEHCQKQRWEKPEYTMVRILIYYLLPGICINSISSSLRHQTATLLWSF